MFKMGPTTWRWLSSIIIVIAMTSLKSTQAEVAPEFQCPTKPNCICIKDSPREFIIECKHNASSDDIFLLVNIFIKPMHTQVTISCSPLVKPQDFEMLPKMENLNIFMLEIKTCPLPLSSFAEFLEKISLTPSTLRSLKLKANKNTTMGRSLMKGLGGLVRISIYGTVGFEEDIFEETKNVSWLALKSNQIRLHQNLFKPFNQLVTLELSQHELQNFPLGLFKHLTSLRRLNMWQCKISNLTAEVFEGLNGLEELDLSVNLLESLPSDLFLNIPKLKQLNLSANKFTSLPENLFTTTPELEILRINDNNNKLPQLPDRFLSNLTLLTEVQIKKCNIELIPKTLMWESPGITNISFQGNSLKEIPEDLFKDQLNLLDLNLEKNKISVIHDGALQTLTNLKVLNLKNNMISNISKNTFAFLSSLEELNMQKNGLQTIAFEAFTDTKKLSVIDMSYNNLTLLNPIFMNIDESYSEFGRVSPFQNIHGLKHLILNNNKISEIFADWRINHLSYLDLRYNEIMKIEFNDLHFLNPGIIVDLQHNNISEIDFRQAILIVDSQPPKSQRSYNAQITVLINDNPIICDCSLLDFVLYLDNKLDSRVNELIKVDTGDNMCASPESFKNLSLRQVQPHQLLCPLDHPQSQGKPVCPKNCSCNLRPYDRSLIINCGGSRPALPILLPNIQNSTFNNTEFYLNNNMLTDLSNIISNKEALNQIKKMYLNNNSISHISIDDIPNQIEILDLRNNHIAHVNSTATEILKNYTTLKKLLISGNPIECNCDNQPFLSFLQSIYKKVGDYTNVTCSDGSAINKLSVGDLCGTTPAVIASSVIIAVAGLILGIVVAIYYKYQLEIKVWLYARGLCLWWITEKELDKDKIYDAFISFSHRDEDFVVNKLVAELEGGPRPFKICIHFRDWRPGEYISDQILKSVQDSRRTLVILSPNFIDSVWGRMEFKTAHTSALNEGRPRVIIILYGDIGSTDNLDPELKAYLSMNTYLKWGDPLFWDKLRYALPHPPYTKQLMPTHNVLSKKGFDDRLELIHPTTPGTPPGQNTPPAHQAHSNPLMNHVNSIPNGIKSSNMYNGTITMNGLKVNGNAKHSDV